MSWEWGVGSSWGSMAESQDGVRMIAGGGWLFLLSFKQVFQVYMLLYFFLLPWPLSLGQKMCTSSLLLFSSQFGSGKKLLTAELSGV